MTIEEKEQEIIDEFSIYDRVGKGWMKHIRPKKI